MKGGVKGGGAKLVSGGGRCEWGGGRDSGR